MWLLPVFSPVARAATRIYYRLAVGGERVPARGPVLLVANHPNSLLDPALVVAVAGRPVRFLAKAPLFTDRLVGWLVRAAGAIPVHRRQDSAEGMAQNSEAFDAAFSALAAGAAVGIFPEGLSHDLPALAPLRTGAARIALGAAAHGAGAAAHGADAAGYGADAAAHGAEAAAPGAGAAAPGPVADAAVRGFPILPVGLVFRDKERFRSEARVVIGPPVEWSDLAGAGEGDVAAVRMLTSRIDNALRDVTVNLDGWEDAPLVDAADAIWAAEFGGSPRDADRLLRLRAGVARLAALRRDGDPRWQQTAREVLRHARLLSRLGLTPASLHDEAALRRAAGWAARRLPLAAAAPVAWLGAALFWPAWRLTGAMAEAMKPDANLRSTNKLLVGIAVYTLWLLLLVTLAGVFGGGRAAAAAVPLLPLFGLGTLLLREELRASRRDARRFLIVRSRRRLVGELRTRQRRLAEEIARAVPAAPAAGPVSQPS